MQLCNWIAGSLLLLSLQLVAEAARASKLQFAAGLGSKRHRARVRADFKVYWNVPTFMCHKYLLKFAQVSQRFGIVQNHADDFQGDKIAILYDPGAFPALLQSENDTILVRNGGVPQEGELELHLQLFRSQLEQLVPDPHFSGLGVIDMESWRPVFRQNWASLQIYRNYSLELERRRHPYWSPDKLKDEALHRFESAARDFMRATLQLATRLRPKALWGYYAYPYCFNWSANQQSNHCSSQVKRENDQMSWLFGSASVLYPSVYLRRKLDEEQQLGMVRGRIQEARRLADNSSNRTKIFAYYWFKYQDQRDTYVDKREIVNTVMEIAKRGADGLVLWGSSSDFDSKSKCENFMDYLENSLGPALKYVRRRIHVAAAT